VRGAAPPTPDLREQIARASWTENGPPQSQEFAALPLFRHQARVIQPYLAYLDYLGVAPASLDDWRDIPPVPASAFKSHDLSVAPPEVDGRPGSPGVVFETSGTTLSRPGRVRLHDTDLYEASLLRSFERHLLPDGARLRAIVFGPARDEAPTSSLWFMVDRVVREFAPRPPQYVVRAGEPRWKIADDALAAAVAEGEPLLLLGTTLFFMATFERLAALDRTFALPSGSRAMDTGGAKGMAAEFARADVAAAFERFLGIPPTHLVNEYGMAELGSQFYDDALLAHHEARAPKAGKRIPPWVRTRVLDPETMEEVADGEPGLLVHYDLANAEIPLAIQTEDIGRRTGDRLQLEGRLLGAEPRGCSLTFERFLAEGRA
jgi:hypothetical protein